MRKRLVWWSETRSRVSWFVPVTVENPSCVAKLAQSNLLPRLLQFQGLRRGQDSALLLIWLAAREEVPQRDDGSAHALLPDAVGSLVQDALEAKQSLADPGRDPRARRVEARRMRFLGTFRSLAASRGAHHTCEGRQPKRRHLAGWWPGA